MVYANANLYNLDKVKLWHKRHGHIGETDEMVKKEFATGLIENTERIGFCYVCVEGKQ